MNSLKIKAIIFVVALTVVAAGGWIARITYKSITEGRLVKQARALVGENDLRNANLCLQRALQINPNGVESTRLMADVMELLGSPAALGWRMRVAQLEPRETRFRFDWARTALQIHDYPSAATALAGVDATAKGTADYHKLAGAVEWGLLHSQAAEQHFRNALRLEPANQVTALNLATIDLASTNAALADQARSILEAMTTNSAVSLVALRRLTADAARRKNLTEAGAFSSQLIKHPAATLADKMDHLRLLRAAASPEFDPFLASILEAGKRSATVAYTIGRWLAIADSPTNALRWLKSLPPEIQTHQPTPLVITDCLVLTKSWRELLSFVDQADWGEGEYYRLAVAALAQRSIGQEELSNASWRKAVRASARRLDRLAGLLQVAEASGWSEEQNQLLHAITDWFPKEKWVASKLLTQLYSTDDSAGILELLKKVQAADPADVRLKNNLASICLLRENQLDKAHGLAKEAYDSEPDNAFYASTYAYSLLLRGDESEALAVTSRLKPEALQIPAIAAYAGVVHAYTGDRNAAKQQLEKAIEARLLPEEKEMIRRAMAKL